MVQLAKLKGHKLADLLDAWIVDRYALENAVIVIVQIAL